MYNEGNIVEVIEDFQNMRVPIPFITKIVRLGNKYGEMRDTWVVIEVPEGKGWGCSESLTTRGWAIPVSHLRPYTKGIKFFINPI